MSYSVMIWLMEPGNGSGPAANDGSSGATRRGGSVGVTAPPAATHLSYGHFDEKQELHDVLAGLARSLAANEPVRVTHGSRTYLIPAARVHYVVSEEVSRPNETTETP